jgi:hypothetical protein
MLTPKPFDLKLVVLGNNQVAFDAVCCAIIGLNAGSVDHIRLAEERGFGPTNLDQIEISGDVTLDEAKRRARGFDVGLTRVEKYFEGTNITAYAGPPPDAEISDYCWGGCPGAIEEAIEILRQFDDQCDAKMPRLHVVFGAYRGPINAGPGEKVVFIGDCCNWKGTLQGQQVGVESEYRDRKTKDPYVIKHDDIYAKMVSVTMKIWDSRKSTHLRLRGCPVSVAEHVLALSNIGGTKNPILDPDNALRFNRAYLGWRANAVLNRIKGRAYQRKGPCQRGQAAPVVEESRD